VTIEGQGDVFAAITSLPVLDGEAPCPQGVVVLSQTCDVVREELQHVTLAPIVCLGALDARNARAGKMPRYVHIPALGDHRFADLDVVAVAAKLTLAGQSREQGVATDLEIRTFGAAVARRFGRFAFPDEVSEFLKPLRNVIQSKAVKPASPMGGVLESVVELRIEAAGSWSSPPWNLTLSVVVKPGTLPLLDDLTPSPTVEVSRDLSASRIAELISMTTDSGELIALWNALGEAWIDTCGDPTGALASIASEVVGEDEYTLDRYRRSERLDLDHLSAPTPT